MKLSEFLKFLNINKGEDEKTSKKIIRNTIWIYAGFIFNSLIGVAILPFILHRLGNDAYGVFAIVGVVITYVSLLEFGIGTSLAKFIAEYNAKNEYEKINKTISTALILYLILGVAGCSIILIFTDYFVTSVFNIPDNLIDVSRTVFAISAVTFLFSLVFGVFGNIIIGLQRLDILTKAQVAMRVFSSAAVISILFLGYGLLEFVIVSSLFVVIGIIINTIIAKRLMQQLSLIPKHFDLKYVYIITSFSFGIFITNIAANFAFHIDKLIIGIFLPVEYVTIYVVGSTLALFIHRVPSNIVSVIIPAASELDAKNRGDAIKELVLKGTKFAVALSTPLFIVLFVFAHPIMNFWMGEGFETSAYILQILSIGFFINTLTHAIVPVLVGIGKIRIYTILSILYMILNVGLSVPLILKLGVSGAAIGTSISISIWSLASLVYGMYLFKISPMEFIKRIIKIKK